MLAHNGEVKAVEELGELIKECAALQQVLAKHMQFPNREHPDGKGPLLERISAESADVLAAIDFLIGTFNLDRAAIFERKERKLELLHQFHSE